MAKVSKVLLSFVLCLSLTGVIGVLGADDGDGGRPHAMFQSIN